MQHQLSPKRQNVRDYYPQQNMAFLFYYILTFQTQQKISVLFRYFRALSVLKKRSYRKLKDKRSRDILGV